MIELYRVDNDPEYAGREVEPSPSASDMLRTAREEKGLSQREVADRLFLSETFVRYMDDGEFHKIPKQAFVKGYLRSYARVVDISGDDVVACYQKTLDEARDLIEVRDSVEESVGVNSFTGPVVQTGIAGLAGLLSIVALVWWLVSGDEAGTPEITATATTTTTQSTATGTEAASGVGAATPSPGMAQSMETTEPEAAAAPPIDDAEPVSEITAGNAPMLHDPEPVEPAAEANAGADVVSIETVTEDGKRYITVNAGGNDRLELSFSDECWIEVQDARGDTIYADLNHEGDVLKISGVSPFKVLLGRASSVALYFNDKSVDLVPYIASNNTARITLDN